MGFLSKVKSFFQASPVESGSYKAEFYKRLQAKYDAAQTTDDNERHWANADFLSANASLKPGIAARIRSRARYEAIENNSYAKGMILTLANDLIGRGPRLQLKSPSLSYNEAVEQRFAQWSEENYFPQTLRTMRMGKCIEGAGLGQMRIRQRDEMQHPLQVIPLETDRLCDPYSLTLKESEGVNGIRFDDDGDPARYHLLREHPGAMHGGLAFQGDWIDARWILHIYRMDRAEQRLGLCEIVTALPLFAMLRRFTLATVAAAETAASYGGVMYTDAPAISAGDELSSDEWYEAIPLEHRALLTLPHGWKMEQLRSEHPQTTYEMFKREIVNEIARCINMPYNIAASNSSKYNYSSGRLDHHTYHKSLLVERSDWNCMVLNRVFRMWMKYAEGIPNYLPDRPDGILTWDWHYDPFGTIDEAKAAQAAKTRIQSGISTIVEEARLAGLDLRTAQQNAAEFYGKSLEEYQEGIFLATFANGNATEPTPEGDDDGEPESEEEEEGSDEETANA